MFLEKLISVDYTAILIAIIVLVVLCLLVYVMVVVLSFTFMHVFKRKLKKGKQSINLILYQKNDCLLKLSALYRDKLANDTPIVRYLNNEEYKKFTELKVEEFEDFYNFLEKMLSYVQKAYVTYAIEDKESFVRDLFLTISELNNKYLQAIQLYNTNVIGYNYWRNLFSTRWIKNLLFIKNINTIK